MDPTTSTVPCGACKTLLQRGRVESDLPPVHTRTLVECEHFLPSCSEECAARLRGRIGEKVLRFERGRKYAM